MPFPLRRFSFFITLLLAGTAQCLAAADETCVEGEQRRLGAYSVENNTWAKGDARGYRQCVGIRASPDSPGAADAWWEWSWPVPERDVRAYPQLIYGQKPWHERLATPLPRVIDAIRSANAEFAFTSSHSGRGNLAFDLWLTRSDQKTGDRLPLQHEVMIWVDNFGMTPAGKAVDSVEIGGSTWDLYITTATWGPEPFTYLAYLPRGALASPIRLDLRRFLDHLKARGTISGREWLASVELGNEVIAGSGRTEIRGFRVTID